ncbi:MAG: nucleotidyltransferase [Deltaproteobacteria bacterium]|nr:nucleotidyltransferase [Deltaproteobacteria bacterium]
MKVFSLYNPLNVMEQVDIMIENYIDFDQAYEQRETVHAKNIEIPIISVDDLIILKEKAGRERDKIDIRALRKIKELKNEEQ